jgi:hypothetical protein
MEPAKENLLVQGDQQGACQKWDNYISLGQIQDENYRKNNRASYKRMNISPAPTAKFESFRFHRVESGLVAIARVRAVRKRLPAG